MGAKYKDIKTNFRFRPIIKLWTSHMSHKSVIMFTYQQTWYGGKWFVDGIFVMLQLNVFAIHVKITWWEFAFFTNCRPKKTNQKQTY